MCALKISYILMERRRSICADAVFNLKNYLIGYKFENSASNGVIGFSIGLTKTKLNQS